MIEDESDFCYFCGYAPNVEDGEECISVEVEENIEESVLSEIIDHNLHGIPLYEIEGNRGRKLLVYQNKCVIKTDVTIGSILSKNATDGEKTIYFKDVIGVQMKKPGLTIGYLQLETAANSGNNSESNYFNENSFTFSNYKDVYEVYKYIISRLDEIKK